MPNAAKERASEQTDGHPSGDERFALLDKALKRSRFAPDQLIEILHAGQEVFGYLSDDVLNYVARALRLPLSRVYGVATFYHLFTLEEPGDHAFTVCMGTACFVKGADKIVDTMQREYGIAAGGTTDDGRFSLKTARCLGACGLAPIGVLDGVVRGDLSSEAAIAAVTDALAADSGADGSDQTEADAAPVAAGTAGEVR